MSVSIMQARILGIVVARLLASNFQQYNISLGVDELSLASIQGVLENEWWEVR